MTSENIMIRTSSNLLNNSFDLLYSTLETFKRFDGEVFSVADEKELKSALITTITSVELILKSKIASINWTQLFSNPKNADKKKLIDGTIFSLNLKDCLSRIEDISDISFSKKNKDDIENIRKIRNKITHFHVDLNKEEFIAFISLGLDFFIEFYQNYIYTEFCEDIDRSKTIDKQLKDIKKYVHIRLTTLQEKYKSTDKPKTYYFSECNNCFNDSYILHDKNTVKCFFCHNEEQIKWVAEIHSNLNGETKICSECQFHSMTAIHSTYIEEEAWDCVICGNFINKPRQWRISLNDESISEDSIKKRFKPS